jgi:hypothetical protein
VIRYLKMSEANALTGQFEGWSKEAREKKLRGLTRVIRHFEPMSFEFSVSLEEHDRIVKPSSPRGLGNVHFSCILGVTFSVARCVHGQGASVPIEFIFDQQHGVGEDFQFFFESLKEGLARGPRSLIHGVPAFKDDRECLPLQAADMLAWHIRREHDVCTPPATLPMADLLRNARGHLVSAIDEPTLRAWSEHFDTLPGVPLIQRKKDWRDLKREIARLTELGFIPPKGTRWMNAIFHARERLNRVIHSALRRR